MAERLSNVQAHILGTLDSNGACDARELSRHLLLDGNRLAGSLRGLEWRGLVGRTYTGHNFGSGHAYVLTAEGRAALADYDWDAG